MSFNKECADALETLAWHEAAVSAFYKACATLFAEQGEFWSKLAAEEEKHSTLLLGAKDLIKNEDNAPFDINSINLTLTESSTRFVQKRPSG